MTVAERDTVTFWVQFYESDGSTPIDLTTFDSIEAAGVIRYNNETAFEVSSGNGIVIGGTFNHRLTFTLRADAHGEGTWDCAGIINGEKHFLLCGDMVVRKTHTRIDT